MTSTNDIWMEWLRRRWTRESAHLYVRPDASRCLRPDGHRFLRHEHARITGSQSYDRKYSPDQPRVPAGNPDGGQWRNGGNSASPAAFSVSKNPSSIDFGLVMSDATPDAIRPGAQYAEAQLRVRIEYSRALTGISQIDDTTIALSKTLSRSMETMDFIPEWSPAQYGTAVHVAFGTMVRFQGLRGISYSDVEHSFVDGKSADYYGQPNSIRTDVILRNDIGDIVAVYDVKTGNATLSAGRVREIREKTNIGSNVPIIELNVLRGAMIKARIDTFRTIGAVIARLWN